MFRSHAGWVRYEPADQVWFAALARLLPRRRRAATLLTWHPRLDAGKYDTSNSRKPGRPPTVPGIARLAVRLPPGVDLPAYRIVQEALTNTLRHAGPAHADVLVRYHRHALELKILDDDSGGSWPGPPARAGGPSGHELVGMRERVTLYGGTLHTGPRATPAGTGYVVRVHLLTKPDGT